MTTLLDSLRLRAKYPPGSAMGSMPCDVVISQRENPRSPVSITVDGREAVLRADQAELAGRLLQQLATRWGDKDDG